MASDCSTTLWVHVAPQAVLSRVADTLTTAFLTYLGELASMVSSAQHRTMDVCEDVTQRNNVFASSSVMENGTEMLFQPKLVEGPREGNINNIQAAGRPNPGVRPLHTCAGDARCAFRTVSGIEGSNFGTDFKQSCLDVGHSGAEAASEVHTPNIIIFGETGAGKSSLVNLIAGRRCANVSNGALACTFQHQRYNVTLDGRQFALWDTAGLDEGSQGTIPAKIAESNLSALMRRLAQSEGIHLVIYCIRGNRLTRALKRNYDLFYATVCRKKVPVALVVTGLEYQEDKMEMWWTTNEETLLQNGMRFDAHACVTTLDVEDTTIQARRLNSQEQLQDLVVKYTGKRSWKIEASLISWTMLHNILRGITLTRKRTIRRAIVYDPIAPCQTQIRLIGYRSLEYELVYVDHPLMPSASCKSAGVLIFHTSALRSTCCMLSEDIAALRSFYKVAGGGACHMIVVIRGCNDEEVAQACWDAVASHYGDLQARPTVDEQEKVDAMIEELYAEHVEVKATRIRRAYWITLEFLATATRWLIESDPARLFKARR